MVYECAGRGPDLYGVERCPTKTRSTTAGPVHLRNETLNDKRPSLTVHGRKG